MADSEVSERRMCRSRRRWWKQIALVGHMLLDAEVSRKNHPKHSNSAHVVKVMCSNEFSSSYIYTNFIILCTTVVL